MRAPSFPKTNTLTGRALMRLLQGKKFTHRDFFSETASYRLSGYILNLRNRHGWQVEAIKETSPTNDKGRKATYARYSIEKDVLRLAKAELGAERVTNFIHAVQKFEAGE
ncbi:hypothetical protein GO003_017880 [Methylicorpusculum oleiharenae]|uniref:hypothetical protein n=1 Tax=Methylicorpusculum oleiharenae TaxID=1338687 RepID=UPI001E2A851E|nr:hypothetical protein [Methylicorpusculum oleiharenae]MCD2452262.1 hypothetical protein [Methylicorpusculum oleiharenae]